MSTSTVAFERRGQERVHSRLGRRDEELRSGGRRVRLRGCPIPESQICRGRGRGAADLGEAQASGDRCWGRGCLSEPAPMFTCKKNI